MRALVPILIGLACRNETKSTIAEPEDAIVVTDMDGDGFEASEDCDDSNDTVYPGADEQCDGIDSDCDGSVEQRELFLGDQPLFPLFLKGLVAVHLKESGISQVPT